MGSDVNIFLVLLLCKNYSHAFYQRTTFFLRINIIFVILLNHVLPLDKYNLWRIAMEITEYTHQGLAMFLKELGIQLTKPTMNLLAWIMLALLEKTAAHLFRLAEKLPDDDTNDMARRQKVRRFMSNHRVFPYLFLHAFIMLIRPLFQSASILELVLDRTEWVKRGTPINVLDAALSYKGRAIPLFWLVSNRRGNSSLKEQKAALTPVIEALRSASWTQGKQIHLTADREFASPKLAEWLWVTFRVGSTLRLKRSEYLNSEAETVKISKYLQQLHPGNQRFLRRYTITQSNSFVMNVAVCWDKAYEEPWVLMTTHVNLPEAIQAYGNRHGIEPMHKDWKSNAFDIEGTRVTDAKRIETLLITIALCYILCVLEGDRKETAGENIRAHKEKRTTGLFLVGLCAFTRILRSTTLCRIQHFFYRLFVGWSWPHKLETKLLNQKC